MQTFELLAHWEVLLCDLLTRSFMGELDVQLVQEALNSVQYSLATQTFDLVELQRLGEFIVRAEMAYL